MTCSFTLSKLHPLLGYAVDLEGTDYIKSTLEPAQMHLPSEMMSLRLEPLRVPMLLIQRELHPYLS